MFAKINHIAIISANYTLLGQFYEAVFAMQPPRKTRPGRAITVGDGYVGLNINPRRAGRPARLDHFGIQVEDVPTVFDRIRKQDPRVEWLQRPSNRPFAGITAHDPDGNVFDISQKDMKNRDAVYTEDDRQQDRFINHVALRTRRPELVAQFYRDVFAFQLLNKAADDPNHYLSDGRITLEIMPWHITDFAGTGIESPGLDHIGFKVESIDTFDKELTKLVRQNQYLAPNPLSRGEEGAARLALFQRSCPLGTYHMSDSDGTLIDVSEQSAARQG